MEGGRCGLTPPPTGRGGVPEERVVVTGGGRGGGRRQGWARGAAVGSVWPGRHGRCRASRATSRCSARSSTTARAAMSRAPCRRSRPRRAATRWVPTRPTPGRAWRRQHGAGFRYLPRPRQRDRKDLSATPSVSVHRRRPACRQAGRLRPHRPHGPSAYPHHVRRRQPPPADSPGQHRPRRIARSAPRGGPPSARLLPSGSDCQRTPLPPLHSGRGDRPAPAHPQADRRKEFNDPPSDSR